MIPEEVWWPQWRIILAGVATLAEVETHYSLIDVFLANDALDAKIALEKEAHDRAMKDAKK